MGIFRRLRALFSRTPAPGGARPAAPSLPPLHLAHRGGARCGSVASPGQFLRLTVELDWVRCDDCREMGEDDALRRMTNER